MPHRDGVESFRFVPRGVEVNGKDFVPHHELENCQEARERAIRAHTKAYEEIQRLQKIITDLQEWCRVERCALGAVDGYDYSSGQEYGLRRAEIEIEKQIQALRSDCDVDNE